VNVLNGTLSLGHRPKVKILKLYKHYGISHIWTLLSEKEGALDIRQATLNSDLEWVWLPLANGKEPEIDRLKEIEICFNMCKELLNSGANIHMHCSAGIHRTGMISYAFLRHLGYSGGDALAKLREMRTITSEGVGEERLKWGDSRFG
jgi:protein-tyrosine phosphatase